jgi:hypothetical protein
MAMVAAYVYDMPAALHTNSECCSCTRTHFNYKFYSA